MLVFFIFSLFHVEQLSQNYQNILNEVNNSVIANGYGMMNLYKYRLTQEPIISGFTVNHAVTYEKKPLEHSNSTFALLSATIFVNKGSEEVKYRNNTEDGSGADGKERKPRTVANDNEVNGMMDDEWGVFNDTFDEKGRPIEYGYQIMTSQQNLTTVTNDNEFNRTMDDEWGVFNDTFDEKAREDGYKITTPEQNPYSVLLIFKMGNDQGHCTGSLLTSEWVLTAAHCIKSKSGDANRMDIYAGINSKAETKGGNKLPATAQKLTSTEFYPHPKYKLGYRHDVALVRARGKFNMTSAVKTIKLAMDPWTVVGYTTCKITGFGKVNYKKASPDDGKRKTHTLQVKKPCKCNFKLKQSYGMEYPTKSYICTKPVMDYGICSGDSGGGLVCGDEVRATAMMIVEITDMDDCEVNPQAKLECGVDHGLSIFLDTCPYLRWISSLVAELPADRISPKCVEVDGQPRAHVASLLCLVISSLLALCNTRLSINVYINYYWPPS